MGLPISPILAQIVMDWALDRILEGLPFVPPFIYKFVDNIITSIVGHLISQTLDFLNNFNGTMENGDNKSVLFLA